jgi:hypothetical protein
MRKWIQTTASSADTPAKQQHRQVALKYRDKPISLIKIIREQF